MLVAMAQEAKAERRPRASSAASVVSMNAWACLTVGAAAWDGTFSVRGALVDGLVGVTGLRGATIGIDQVLPLAPVVFADLGITITE